MAIFRDRMPGVRDGRGKAGRVDEGEVNGSTLL